MTDLFERETRIEITKEIAPWAPEEELGTYTVKRWSWFDDQRAACAATTTLDRDKGIVETDLAEYYARMMLNCVTPPESLEGHWNLDRVRLLDRHIGLKLKNACRDVNGLTWEEKASFLEPSEATKGTPG